MAELFRRKRTGSTAVLDPVKKRVMTELFLAPSVVLPLVGGISAWLVSWGIGNSLPLNAAGLVAILGGIGWFSTRFVFQLESITAKAMQYVRSKERQQENAELDQLAAQFQRFGDRQSEHYLGRLRSLKLQFETMCMIDNAGLRNQDVVDQVRELYRASIQQLQQTLRLLHIIESLQGEAREVMLKQRQKIVDDVGKAVDHLQSAIPQFATLFTSKTQEGLSQLRDELDESLRIAKRTEERLRELESSPSYESFNLEKQ